MIKTIQNFKHLKVELLMGNVYFSMKKEMTTKMMKIAMKIVQKMAAAIIKKKHMMDKGKLKLKMARKKREKIELFE